MHMHMCTHTHAYPPSIGIVKPLTHFLSHDLESLKDSKKKYQKARSEAIQATDKFSQCKKYEMGQMTEVFSQGCGNSQGGGGVVSHRGCGLSQGCGITQGCRPNKA